MARIRTIKPEFFTSEDIVSLSPFARLLYVALWLEADREGRLVWKPKTFKLRFLPGDNCDIEALALELLGKGLVATYESSGQTFAEIPTFARHQVINNRERASVIPARVSDATSTRDSRVNDAASPSARGRERKGKERKGYASGGDVAFDAAQARTASRFAEFWQAWPTGSRKVAKVECERKWSRRNLDPIADKIIGHLTALSLTQQFRDFTPAPLTYLNQSRWEDEISSAVLSGVSQSSGVFKGAL